MAVVLITGCGSGFGRAMAVEFARRGDEVYAAVRVLPPPNSASTLKLTPNAARGVIHTIVLDVTSGASIEEAVGAVLSKAGRVDVLVNNAGLHRLGAFEDMPESELRLMMEVNFFGPIRLTRAVLPLMRKQSSGHVIMISSIGALISRAIDAYYCASKSALEAASEALRYEVERFGIRVTAVEPGAFRTEVAEKGAAALYDLTSSPYGPLVRFRSRKVREACRSGDDPELVARAVADIAHAPIGEFRQPLGAQANRMARELRALDEAGRASMIRAKSQIQWWTEGTEEPPEAL
jgi:NAD(P)-dependent dehydrogenase (short-subunit alcohol dehydrogenase family)